MARKPLDRTQLDVRELFELPHPDSTDRRPKSYRYIIGLHLASGGVAYACAYDRNAYTTRDSCARHLRRDHGRQSASAAITAGRVRFHVDPPELPPADESGPATDDQEPTPPDLDPPNLGDAAVSLVTQLASELDAYRDRALALERRLASITGALNAPTSALPVIGGGDGG